MSKLNRVPSYRKHRQSGQAIGTLTDSLGNRRDVLLGKFGTAASRHEYARMIAEWQTAGRELPKAAQQLPSVNEIILAYWKHCEGHYRKANGKPTSEPALIKMALRSLKALYADTTAAGFGPLAFKAVRQEWVNTGMSRGVVNSHAGRVRRMFKSAVENELVPSSVFHGLQAVRGLQYGRSGAKETKPVKPVPEAFVEAVCRMCRALSPL